MKIRENMEMYFAERLKNIKVKEKLNLYKKYMLGIIVVLGIVVIVLSLLLNLRLKEITEVWAPTLECVQQLDILTSNYRVKQYGHLVSTTDAEMREYEAELSEIDKKITIISERFMKYSTSDEERKISAEVNKKWLKYKAKSERVLEASRAHNTKNAGLLMIGDVLDTYQDFQQDFDKLTKFARAELQKAKDSANLMFIIIVAVIVILILIAIVVATMVARIVTRMITEPIAQIEEAVKRMHQGDMSAGKLITYESSDEIGIVADSLRGAMKNLQDYIEEISSTLGEIAKGDLTKDSNEITDFLGDFAEIKESLIHILKSFNSTLTNIQKTSELVSTNSIEISASSQSLANGAANQASAIEELTATIATVVNLAEKSAEDTQKAYDDVKQSTQKAEYGKQKMKELTEEMNSITEISRKIENIITAIENIASQTNLLSLNASIEAARAGSAGRGFAVVAGQIGKLAADSAQSAVNTRELISKTLEEIEKGNIITASTSEAIEAVIREMNGFAEVARMTNQNVENQTRALEQIDQGIQEIAGAVQNTAAASEENTAISENLKDRAAILDEMIKRFKLY